jgi:multiple sugar transport system ATP-binding protein
MPNIRIEHVTKRFGIKKALDGVSLTIKDKSFTCILGPPGTGKTTLLRILIGLEKPDKGEIYVNGENVTLRNPGDREISLVAQSFALYPHMKVYENIAYPLKLKKIPKLQRRKKVKEIARFLKIDNLLDRVPTQLSGGEQQRVAIARAMVKKAKVFLFDEPLTNLDYKIREDMRGEFHRMQREMGQTIIYATSDPVEAMAMSEYVAIFNQGRLDQFGKTDYVYNNPQNLFAGTYFGYPKLNTFEVHLETNNNRLELVGVLFSIDVTSLAEIFSPQGEYVIGIRPEKIHLEEREGISLKLETLLSEVIGSDTILHLHALEPSESVRVFLPEVYEVDPGRKIKVGFNVKDILIFDKKSGKLLCKGDTLGTDKT